MTILLLAFCVFYKCIAFWLRRDNESDADYFYIVTFLLVILSNSRMRSSGNLYVLFEFYNCASALVIK